jgi:hypothetical protein
MTRAQTAAYWSLRLFFRNPLISLRKFPKIGYCDCCGSWGWNTNEVPAYSAYDGAYLCEECAIENDKETDMAWAAYYAGRL